MDIGAYLRSKLDDFKNTVASFVPTVTRQNDGSQYVQFSPQASQAIRNVGNVANTISRSAMQGLSPGIGLYNQANRNAPINNPMDLYTKIKPVPIIGDLATGVGNSVGNFGTAFSRYATSKAPLLSKQGAQEYGNMLGKGAIAGANIFGASRLTPGLVAANSAFGGALNAVGSSNPLDSFVSGARQAAQFTPNLAGIGAFTNPAIQKIAGKAASLVGGPVSQQLASRFATGLANIPEGMIMRKGQGMDGYGLADAGIDFGMGALLGPGGKVGGKRLKSNIVRSMHPEDINVMDKSIDVLRNKKAGGVPAAEAEHYIRVLAEHYLPKGKVDIAKDNPLKLGKMLQKLAGEVVGDNASVPGLGLYAGPGAIDWKSVKGKFSSLADRKTKFEIDDSKARITLPDKISTAETKRLADLLNNDDGREIFLSKMLEGYRGDVSLYKKELQRRLYSKTGDLSKQAFKLSDILKHDDLYKQYPDFKNITVKIQNDNPLRPLGSYNRYTNTIELSVSSTKDKSTLLHEIQHALQEKEDFAKGGSPGVGSFDDYQRRAGEIEARDVQSRMNLSPEQRRTTQPYASQGIPLNKQVVNFDGGLSENAVLDRSNSVLFAFQKATDHIDDFNMKGSAIKSIVDEKLTRVNPKSVTPEQLQDLKATRAALNKSLYGPVEDEASRRMAADMKDIPEVAGFYNDITDSVAKIDSILKGVSKQKGFEIEPNFITSKDKRVKPVMDKMNPYVAKVGDTQFVGNDRKKLTQQVSKFMESQNATRITAQDGKIKVKQPEDVLRDLQRTARPNESVMQQDARLLKSLPTSDFEREMDAMSKTFVNDQPRLKARVIQEPPRGFTREDSERVASIAQANASENKKGFDMLFDKWIGQRDVAKTTGYERGSQFKDIPKESGPAVIKFIENPESQAPREVRQYADKLRKSYDELYNNAQQSGIDMGYLKNYITHIWDKPSDEVAQIYKAAKQRFNFANERVLPTYEEGIRLGLKPKYSTPQQIIAEYARKLEETKANVDFFNTARKDGFIVDATIGSREPGFSPLVGPGFPKSSSMAPDGTRVQGFYYAPTNIANQINRLFSPQDYGNLGKAMNIGKKISATIQDVTLSGGLPGTAINAFTIAQAQKEALSGRVVSPITSLFRSISPKMSNDYFERNVDTIKKMQANNIPLSTTLNVEDLVGGLNANGAGGKLKQLWNKSVNDPTFKRFMPMLQINLFKDIESQALKGGVSPEEATAIATKAVKNFYGVTGSGVTARRNQFVSDAAGTFLFAPKFRESMINFWVNSVKSLKNPLALENRANVKFLAGATLTFAAMNLMQKELTGQYLWDNPDNKKDKMLIPLGNGSDIVLGVPFLSSIATVPRNIASAGIKVAKGDLKGAIVDSARAFGSTTAKLPAELIANEDYFGNQIYNENDGTLEKYKKMGGYAFKSLNHPYVRAALSVKDNMQDASGAKPGYQIASETMELPIRFYKQKSIDSSYYYDAVKKSLETLSQDEMSAYKALPSNSKVLESDDPSKAIVNANIMLAYPKVFEAKRMAQLQTAKGDMTKIDPLYLADDASVKKYLRYQTLPPGSSDKKDMYAANPEIGDLAKARSEYFAANPLPGGNTSNKPMPSQYVQQQMDAKNWKDPQVRSYLDANTAYNNDQRAKLGLPPLAGFISSPKKASGPKKIKVAKMKTSKVKLKKVKLTKIKVKKAKLSKIKALKVPKYKAPKFS